MRTLAWVALIIFVVDQVSKYYIVHMLNLATVRAIDVWPPYLNLRMAWNYGINFGLLATDSDVTRWALIVVALVISGAVIWWLRREPGGLWQNKVAG